MSNALAAEIRDISDAPAGRARADASEANHSTSAVVEMLLKDRGRLNRLLRDESQQRELLPRMLAIALIGFAMYGVVVTAIFNAVRLETGLWPHHMPAAFWNDASVVNLTLAYTLGLIAANGICLPSFYFYGLLAGVKISMLGVAAHSVKGMAAGAVALVGLLPIYAAAALAVAVFPLDDAFAWYCYLWGLMLPFVAGLFGASNLYEGFVALADTMTCHGHATRACFLRRLIMAWVGCSAFVIPIVVYSLWDYLNAVTAAWM